MYCKYCDEDKEESKFEVANIKNGKIYKRRKCSSCKNITQKERLRKNRIWLDEYKKVHPCSKCGFSDYRALQFHHLNPLEKDKNISMMTWNSINSIKKEIEKCIVLCANCHSIEEHNIRISNK